MNGFVILVLVFLQDNVLHLSYGSAISSGQDVENGSRGKLGAIWGPKEGLSWTDDISQDDDTERFPEDWVISGEDWQRKKRSPMHRSKFKWSADPPDELDEDSAHDEESKKKGQWSSSFLTHSKDKHRKTEKGGKKTDVFSEDYELSGTDKGEDSIDNPWPNVPSAVKSFKGENSRYSKNWDSSPKHMRYAETPLGEKGGLDKPVSFDEDYNWGTDKKDEPMLEGDSYWLGGFAAALRLVLGREMAERTALAHQPPYVSLADVGKSINEVCAIEKKKQAVQDNERLQRIMRKLSLLAKTVNSETRPEDITKMNETALEGKVVAKQNLSVSDAKSGSQAAIHEPEETTSSIVTASIMKTVAPQVAPVAKDKISSDHEGDKIIFSKPVSNSSESSNATRSVKGKTSKESIAAPRRKVQARKTETEADRRINPRAAECTFRTTLSYTVFTCPGETTTCPFCPEETETLRFCPLEPSDSPPRATRKPPNMYHVAHFLDDFGGDARPKESKDIKRDTSYVRNVKRDECGVCGVTSTTTSPPRVTCKKDWRTETPWPVATKKPPNNYHVAHSKEGIEATTQTNKLEEVGDIPPKASANVKREECGVCGVTTTTTSAPRVTCKKDWRTETPWPVATKKPPNNYHVAHLKESDTTPTAHVMPPIKKVTGFNLGKWLNQDFDYTGDLINNLDRLDGCDRLEITYNKDNDPMIIDKSVSNRLVKGPLKM